MAKISYGPDHLDHIMDADDGKAELSAVSRAAAPAEAGEAGGGLD
jgi:hypothetical protein